MNLAFRRSDVFAAAMAVVAATAAVPAFAQTPITVVSPHAGESVDDWRPYIVRWTADAIPGLAHFTVHAVGASAETEHICTAAAAERDCEWFEPSLPNGGARIVIEARDQSGTVLGSAESGMFQLEDQGLGAEWISRDFGDVGRSGGTRGSGITNGAQPIEVRGAGDDIWGTADAFHYAFREMPPGDFDASATITAVEGTEAWTKVGLMLRREYGEESAHHFVLASRGKGIAYQRRPAAGGETLHTSLGTSSTLPVRVEAMRRSGYTVMNVKQGDGPWREVAAFDEGEGTLLVGLAVTSHDQSVIAAGRFADVNVDINHMDVGILKPDAFQEIEAGVPFTIEWTQREPMHPATVSWSVDNGQTWMTVPGCESIVATTCLWNDPGPESERARVRVVVHDPDNREAWAATYPFAIRADPVTPLPGGWQSGDVGAVGAAGTASYSSETGQFTVQGSGADIWGTADEFHFVSRVIVDDEVEPFDLEVTARVMSVQNVDSWTKAGLMIRAHRGAGSPHASLFVTPTTEKGVAFQRRRSEPAASVHTAGPPITAPVWLKLTLRSNVVRAYYRARATDRWTLIGQDAFDYRGTFEVGLALTSHADGQVARATFDQVSVRFFDLGSADQDIGPVGVAGSTRADDITITMEGSGADIWNTADAFRYRFTDISPGGLVSARVWSIENTHAWAKAGVMMRHNLSPGSPHVMLIVSPGKGIAMQYRATQDGASANVALGAGTAPEWLRLTRDGGAIVGEVSDDGVAWRLFGRIVLPMGDFITAGLVATSHDNATLATAVFDDVVLQR